MFSDSALEELETWPYEVLGDAARFLSSGYTYKVRETREFTEMSSGAPLSRLLSRHNIAECSGKLLLTDGQLGYFEWWYYNKINNGNDWFKIKLMTGAGLNTVPAKFAKNGRGMVSKQSLLYTFTCNLIAVELPAEQLSEAQAISLASTGSYQLQVSINKLYEIIHEDW